MKVLFKARLKSTGKDIDICSFNLGMNNVVIFKDTNGNAYNPSTITLPYAYAELPNKSDRKIVKLLDSGYVLLDDGIIYDLDELLLSGFIQQKEKLNTTDSPNKKVWARGDDLRPEKVLDALIDRGGRNREGFLPIHKNIIYYIDVFNEDTISCVSDSIFAAKLIMNSWEEIKLPVMPKKHTFEIFEGITDCKYCQLKNICNSLNTNMKNLLSETIMCNKYDFSVIREIENDSKI